MIAFTHTIVAADAQGPAWCCGAGVFEGDQATYTTMHETGSQLVELFAGQGWQWAVALPDDGRARDRIGMAPLAPDVTFEALAERPGVVVLRAP